MKAFIIREYGDNDVLRQVETEQPTPGPGEVLVRVRAAGINPVDWKIRGGLGERLGLKLPIALGGEITGTVEAVGDGVSTLAAGDTVYGMVPTGGFTEYAVAKADALARRPASLDDAHAAAIPLAGLTAWQALFDVAGLEAGQRLLITGASGGVGSLAVQFARAKGAYVIGTASGRNEEFVRGLGADEFVDYTQQPFEDAVQGVDVVFDTVGGDTFERAFKTLKPGGFLVTSVAFPTDEQAARHGVRVGRVFCKPNATELAEIGALVTAGKVRAHVAAEVPFAELARAFEMSESGRTRGKIVLRIAPEA